MLYLVSEVFLSFGIGTFNYAQPFLYQNNGISDTTIGLIFAANAIVGGAAAFILAPMADKVGVSRVFKLATLTIGLGFLATSLSSGITMWMIASGLVGLGGSMLLTTENVVMSVLNQGQEKANVLSKFVALYTVLIGSGVVFGGWISSDLGYRHTALLGACIALVAPGIRLFVKAPDAKSARLFRLPTGRLVAMSGFAMLSGLAVGLLAPFFTLVLKDEGTLSNSVIGILSASSTFVAAAGAFAVTPLLRKLQVSGTLFLSFGLACVLTIAMLFPSGIWGFVVLYLIRTAIVNVPGSIVDATFLDMTHETEYAQMFGVRVFGNNVGSAIGASSGGALLSLHLLHLNFILSAVGFVVAYVYLVKLLKKLQHVAPMQSLNFKRHGDVEM